MSDTRLSNVELAEALDRVLHKGAVLRGDVVVSVAGVDLLYLDLRVFLSSIDRAMTKEVLPPDSDANEDPAVSPVGERRVG